jgi:tRNA pseudouridine32 synthase / 23S rRNA pseudouridine746 synthase
MLTLFDPQPAPSDLPDRFPSPFHTTPHPIAGRAAEQLAHDLRDWRGEPDGGGKMFGVLVVARADGKIGFLRAFSGMLGRQWQMPGFVPPLFDIAARDAFWPAGEATLAALTARLAALAAETTPHQAALAGLLAHHGTIASALREQHRANRAARHLRRAATGDDPEALRTLADESRRDATAKRRLRAVQATEALPLETTLRALDAQRIALERQRADRSRGYARQLHDTYRIQNARGHWKTLADVFAPADPPTGAGDCAAPKLLAYAYREGLRPIALTELWWGPAPLGGGRQAGRHYAACRGKCRPILAHALGGLRVEPEPNFGDGAIDADEPAVVFEDRWILAVDKPSGLLSVPGRSGALRDSALTRLRRSYPDATGPLVVHRLDLDTSGVLLVAKDPTTHAALQRLFARREVTKRYIAWLDGSVSAERGVVDLALRVDVDDRPRQIHDPLEGKTAVTEWNVIARDRGRTRVALYPRTGRTHQLRVHAAHALGIGVPIVGDRLYGRPESGERLLLHAEALTFEHPHTHTQLTIERPAPF